MRNWIKLPTKTNKHKHVKRIISKVVDWNIQHFKFQTSVNKECEIEKFSASNMKKMSKINIFFTHQGVRFIARG